ncbi:MAG TPA: hypothetical protein ENH95_05020 [Nitrosopumilus sp.]|nr:hypothetical protein [Nitrosopumilus sp.]
MLERLLVEEEERLLRKQKKQPPEGESLKLQQEKVQEEKLRGEELPEKEEEGARTSYSFLKLHLIRTVNPENS